MGLDGRLGNGFSEPQLSPVAASGLPGPAVELALGFGHTCARLVDGDLWCWGRGAEGQLGHGVASGSLSPVRVTPPR